MPTIGRKRGVKRYGVAHGIRFSPTMEAIVMGYARRAGVTLTDAVRLLLEQAIGQRVNAVEAQAERLSRIEDKVDEVLAILAREEPVPEQERTYFTTNEWGRP